MSAHDHSNTIVAASTVGCAMYNVWQMACDVSSYSMNTLQFHWPPSTLYGSFIIITVSHWLSILFIRWRWWFLCLPYPKMMTAMNPAYYTSWTLWPMWVYIVNVQSKTDYSETCNRSDTENHLTSLPHKHRNWAPEGTEKLGIYWKYLWPECPVASQTL